MWGVPDSPGVLRHEQREDGACQAYAQSQLDNWTHEAGRYRKVNSATEVKLSC